MNLRSLLQEPPLFFSSDHCALIRSSTRQSILKESPSDRTYTPVWLPLPSSSTVATRCPLWALGEWSSFDHLTKHADLLPGFGKSTMTPVPILSTTPLSLVTASSTVLVVGLTFSSQYSSSRILNPFQTTATNKNPVKASLAPSKKA